MVSPRDAYGASASRILAGGTEPRPPPAERGPMFDRHRSDRMSLAFSYDVEGRLVIALEDIGSRTIGRLEIVPGGTAPLDSWRADTYGRRWRLDAEGRGSSWGFHAREVSSDNVVASAHRRRWRLGSYDIWMAPDRQFRLRCCYLRDGALSNEIGDRIATIGLGGRAGYVKTWLAAKSEEPALALLLLLTVRVALFEQASRVPLPSAGGGGYA
jgi:hypothetical protein